MENISVNCFIGILFFMCLVQVASASVCGPSCQLGKLSMAIHDDLNKGNTLITHCASLSDELEQDKCYDAVQENVDKVNNEIQNAMEIEDNLIVKASDSMLATLVSVQKDEEYKASKQYWETHLYTSHVH